VAARTFGISFLPTDGGKQMKRSLAMLGIVLLLGSALAMAQDQEAKPRSKPRGVLPTFYGAVVSPDQRERIYVIQQSYAEQISKLEEQLAAIKAKRDKEVEAVLTPEQLAKVKKLQEEARAKREAARQAAQSAAGTKPASETKAGAAAPSPSKSAAPAGSE